MIKDSRDLPRDDYRFHSHQRFVSLRWSALVSEREKVYLAPVLFVQVWVGETPENEVDSWRDTNRVFKQQRFWATHVKRKWAFFSFKIPWRYQICIAKFLCCYRDDLPQKKLLKITSQECNKSTSGLRASLTRKPRRCLNPLVFRTIFVFYEFMFSRWYWGFLNSHSRKELTRTTSNCSTDKMRLHPLWVCTQVTSYLHLLEYDHHLTRCSSFLRLITRLIFLDSRPHIPHRGPHVSIKI